MEDFKKEQIRGNLEWYLVSKATLLHTQDRISELLRNPEVKEYINAVKTLGDLKNTTKYAMEDLWDSMDRGPMAITLDGATYFVNGYEATPIKEIV